MKIKSSYIQLICFLSLGLGSHAQMHENRERPTPDSTSYRILSKFEIKQLSDATFIEKSPTPCMAPVAGAVQLANCNDVGTANFYNAALAVTNRNSTGALMPADDFQCGVPYTGQGLWIQLDPVNTVNIVDFKILNGAFSFGPNRIIMCRFFQGPNCGALAPVNSPTAFGQCQLLADCVNNAWAFYYAHCENINPSQNLWVYVWDELGLPFQLQNTRVIGSSAATVSNDNCASASTSNTGCNLGANGDINWTPPNLASPVVNCAGGQWTSNENTVYFSFTANGTSGSIQVNGVSCNNGTVGSAQFGVWNSCACVGQYTAACFRSCTVGNGSLNLNGLVPGQNYIIVVDGLAGDICKWNFVVTGISLPVELINFQAKKTPEGNLLNWVTGSEKDCAYFQIVRSVDGENYSDVAKVKGNGTTNHETIYSFLDTESEAGRVYYKLLQVDYNGVETSYGPIDVINDEIGVSVYPNPVGDQFIIQFTNQKHRFAVIEIYDALGELVHTINIDQSESMNELVVNAASFEHGIYTLQLKNNDETKHIKFVK